MAQGPTQSTDEILAYIKEGARRYKIGQTGTTAEGLMGKMREFMMTELWKAGLELMTAAKKERYFLFENSTTGISYFLDASGTFLFEHKEGSLGRLKSGTLSTEEVCSAMAERNPEVFADALVNSIIDYWVALSRAAPAARNIDDPH